MKKVELLIRQTKPPAVEAPDPVMCERKDQKPNEQYSVVDDRAPQKKAAREFNAHFHSVPGSLHSGDSFWPRSLNAPRRHLNDIGRTKDAPRSANRANSPSWEAISLMLGPAAALETCRPNRCHR